MSHRGPIHPQPNQQDQHKVLPFRHFGADSRALQRGHRPHGHLHSHLQPRRDDAGRADASAEARGRRHPPAARLPRPDLAAVQVHPPGRARVVPVQRDLGQH